MRDLRAGLDLGRARGLYRSRRVGAGPQQPNQTLDGRALISFCSNDYLGLAGHPEVARALSLGVERYGVGAGAAHLINGHSRAHHALEEELAAFTGRQRALLFSTGYMANLGALSALLGRGDTLFQDRLNHASLLDGGRLSRARLRRYRHADPEDLTTCIAHWETGEALIATDGVFSMDGDLAPLPELAAVAERHGAWLMVDDAHGLGVLGATGRGSLEHWGLGPDRVPILMGTLGKAFGTFGAFIAGSTELIETLIQTARSYIYTTASPPALAEASRTGLRIAMEEGWRRDRLRALIRRFRSGARQLGLSLMPSDTPIQPLMVGDCGRALALSEALLGQGCLVPAIRPPTVLEGSARLRITLSSRHSECQVDRLLEALESVGAAHSRPLSANDTDPSPTTM
jgi:8-amino-7-oxononanoate synthase